MTQIASFAAASSHCKHTGRRRYSGGRGCVAPTSDHGPRRRAGRDAVRRTKKSPPGCGLGSIKCNKLDSTASCVGAQERTRTFTVSPPLGPEPSASTNSATWATATDHFTFPNIPCQRSPARPRNPDRQDRGRRTRPQRGADPSRKRQAGCRQAPTRRCPAGKSRGVRSRSRSRRPAAANRAGATTSIPRYCLRGSRFSTR